MNVKGQDANIGRSYVWRWPRLLLLGSDEGFADIIIWVSVERWRTSTFERRAQVWVKLH